jgi:hypothetical protein
MVAQYILLCKIYCAAQVQSRKQAVLGIIGPVSQIRPLLVAVILLSIAPAPRAAQPTVADEPGITGEVRSPGGSPVTGGSVALMTVSIYKIVATIDRTGHFRIVPDSQGPQRLFIAVPGFAPYRAIVSPPSSRRMTLPPITLTEATYVRVRFVTVDGDLLGPGGLRRISLDNDGVLIPDPLNHTRQEVSSDGTVTIGPLPPGRMMWGFDLPPLATTPLSPTRLPDITIGDNGQVIDRGTIAIQPATQLHVDVLDGKGQPVPQHNVSIDDAIQPSPLSYQSVLTDAKGRATFSRLGRGRYRVFTSSVDRCGRQFLTISRLVSAGSDGPVPRMVIGGRAALRITTPLGALLARQVRLSPDAPNAPSLRPRFLEASGRQVAIDPPAPPSCVGATDADGRVALAPFPPGPAQLRVELFNSTYIIPVNVPDNGREIAVAIPDGLTPVKVIDRTTQNPVALARATWVGTTGRVEALTTANGDALLEAVGANGGTLTISERGYQTLEGVFEVTPDTVQEVALTRLPPELVRISVVTDENKPIGNATITLLGGGELVHFTATDAKGLASFSGIGPGALNVIAHADGFAAETLQVPEDARASIRIEMKTK